MQTGERFDRFLEFVVDYVFSAGTVALLLASGFIFTLYKVIETDSTRQEEQRIAIEKCYSQGMVLVRTDAGDRCVKPSSLVRVK